MKRKAQPKSTLFEKALEIARKRDEGTPTKTLSEMMSEVAERLAESGPESCYRAIHFIMEDKWLVEIVLEDGIEGEGIGPTPESALAAAMEAMNHGNV